MICVCVCVCGGGGVRVHTNSQATHVIMKLQCNVNRGQYCTISIRMVLYRHAQVDQVSSGVYLRMCTRQVQCKRRFNRSPTTYTTSLIIMRMNSVIHNSPSFQQSKEHDPVSDNAVIVGVHKHLCVCVYVCTSMATVTWLPSLSLTGSAIHAHTENIVMRSCNTEHTLPSFFISLASLLLVQNSIVLTPMDMRNMFQPPKMEIATITPRHTNHCKHSIVASKEVP